MGGVLDCLGSSKLMYLSKTRSLVFPDRVTTMSLCLFVNPQPFIHIRPSRDIAVSYYPSCGDPRWSGMNERLKIDKLNGQRDMVVTRSGKTRVKYINLEEPKQTSTPLITY